MYDYSCQIRDTCMQSRVTCADSLRNVHLWCNTLRGLEKNRGEINVNLYKPRLNICMSFLFDYNDLMMESSYHIVNVASHS